MTSAKPFRFIVYGHPATKKNSATLVYGRTRGMRPIPAILPSEAYRAYEKLCRAALAELARESGLPHYDGPVGITALYYLESAAHWPDLTGLMQATADIISDEYTTVNHKRTLAKRWLLADDRIIKNWDGTKIAGIDRECPRIDVTITPLPLDAMAELDPKLRKLAKDEMQGGLFG